MPKRFSKRTRLFAKLAVSLRANVADYAATVVAMGKTADSLTAGTAAVLAYLNSPAVAAAARKLEAKTAPVQLSKFSAVLEHSRVALKCPLPGLGLDAGAVGIVVHTYGKGTAYEVEFLNADGTTIGVATVAAAEVAPVQLSKFRPVPNLPDEEEAFLARITTSGQFTLSKTLDMYAGVRPTTAPKQENNDDDA